MMAISGLPDPAHITPEHHPSDELLASYAAGENDPSARQEIVSHLIHCRPCRDLLAVVAPIINVDPIAQPTQESLAQRVYDIARNVGNRMLSIVVSQSERMLRILDTDACVQLEYGLATRHEQVGLGDGQGASFVRRFRGREIEVYLHSMPTERFHLRVGIKPLAENGSRARLFRGVREIAVAPFRFDNVTFKSLKPAHYTLAIEEVGQVVGHLDLRLQEDLFDGQ
ncbi:MAG: hypothetical protein KKA07_03765 [Bacteroidetes bacterium]|nr:hypothetical protein [Bacteroidota bacterium]